MGFDSPLLSAEVGCTHKISDERGIYTENWPVTYKDLSQILERRREKARQKNGGMMRIKSPDGRMKWLSRGRERERKKEKNASPVVHGALHTCPRINRKCSCIWTTPLPPIPKISHIPNGLPSFSIHLTQLIPAQRCGKGNLKEKFFETSSAPFPRTNSSHCNVV